MNLRTRLRHPIVRYGITLGVIVAAIVVITRTFDIGQAISVISKANLPLFIAGLISYYATFLVRAKRWQQFLTDVDVSMATWPATLVLVVGYYLNLIVPAKLGDLYRSYLTAKEYDGEITSIAGTVAAERVVDLLLLVAGLLILLPVVIGRETILHSPLMPWVLGLLVLLCGATTAVWFVEHLPLPEKVLALLDSFQRGLASATGGNTVEAAGILALSASIWGLNVVRTWFVAASLEIQVSLVEIVVLALLIAFLSGLPYVPAGLGIVEVFSSGLLISFGVEATDALALVLLDRIISVLTLLFIGTGCYLYLVYVRQRTSLKDATASA